MKNKIQKGWAWFKPHAMGVLAGISALGVLTYASLMSPPGVTSWLLGSPALVLITATAIARLNDIGPAQKGWVWQLRRIGLALSGACALMFLLMPFAEVPRYPTWQMTGLVWGFAISWFTSPHMPPWWEFISGNYKRKDSPEVVPEHPLEKALNGD